MHRLEPRRPCRVEVRRHTAEPRLKKALLPLAFPRQITIERWAEHAIRVDPVVKPIDEPGDSRPTAERLKGSSGWKQRRGARIDCASVSETGLNLERD